jgi:hypothetical protein
VWICGSHFAHACLQSVAFHTDTKEPFWVYESMAIARYIDKTFPTGTCLTDEKVDTCSARLCQCMCVLYHINAYDPCVQDAKRRALIDQWSSAAGSYVFPALEFGLIKPRVKLLLSDPQPSPAAITQALAAGVAPALAGQSV